MRIYSCIMTLLLACSFACPAQAAGSMEGMQVYDPNIPVQFGAGQAGAPMLARPPQFPPYLPNGAVNLDEAWIQDGGARLYWDYVIVPRQVRMGGLSWVDPALVPELIMQQPAKKRVYRRPVRRARTVKAKVPPKPASTALKTPPIPVPVTEVPPAAQVEPVPPLKASRGVAAQSPSPRDPASEENIEIQPPRLQ